MDETLIAGVVVAVAVVAAAVLLAFFRKSGARDTSAFAELEAKFDQIDGTLKGHGGQLTAILSAQSQASGELSRTLNERLTQGLESIQTSVRAIGEKLDRDVAAMEKSAVEGREALRNLVEQKLDASTTKHAEAATALRTELTQNFDKTSNLISQTLRQLGADQQERLNEFSARIGELTKQQADGQEKLRQTVEARLDLLRTENSKKLDEMRQTVDEKLQSTLEKRLGESFNTVSEQLKRVHEGLGEMQNLATGVGDLKRVLTNVKTRGTWAEVQLGMLLEDYLTPDQFVENAAMNPSSSERVEFAIRLPARDGDGSHIFLPIDSKFPREDYERLVLASEAADIAGVEAAAVALENSIRNSAKTISEKYINPPHTTDFAFLFLPTEGLFAEVLRRPGFLEKLQRDYRVNVAGPTTLSSMLSAFQMGFRSMAIQQRSGDVWKVLGAVRTEFGKHGEVLRKLKNQLATAANSVDALDKRTGIMSKRLKGVEALPSDTSVTLLGLVGPAYDEPDDEEEAEE
ncbi:MAG: DNA recombination protein RmuC [Alphaproteobacteria bacterium HGW-Alphaproteobacteria-11]|nr:MAG: DNA recombination protein RmuC [Alphaproteobacteria bacterium HGW-Alphaproteobacteria-11]